MPRIKFPGVFYTQGKGPGRPARTIAKRTDDARMVLVRWNTLGPGKRDLACPFTKPSTKDEKRLPAERIRIILNL